MNKWTYTTLGKISEIITGPFGSQLHQSDYVEQGIPVVMPQDIDNRKVNYASINYVSNEDAIRLERYKTIINDILYARRGDVEKHAFIKEKDNGVLCGTGCLRVRITTSEVEPEFISFFLNREETRKWLVTHAVGTNMPNLNTDILSDVPIAYPLLEEQRRIVQVLNSLDEKIALNSAVNDNLEQQAKLLYDYWFTQFDFPDENGKPYRSSGGKMVWNEQLKMEIPFSWICSKMENAIEAVRTGLNPRNNFQLGNGNIQYITVKNLCLNGSLDFSGCDTIDEQARQIVHRRSDIQRDDILFASIAPLGRCYLIQENPTNWDINESVFSIRYNSSVLTAEYLYMNLQSETFVKRATACSTGSIFKGIRINSLMDSEIILPPLSVTKEFSKEIKPLFALQKELDRETHTLIQLRDWLLPMLMNGQATISD